MEERELKKLSRADLLQMMIAQSKELQEYKDKLALAEAALEKREIAINEAGSIAEASLELSGIFEAAQRACQQYTENIHLLSDRQKMVCEEMESKSIAKARQIILEAEQQRKDTLSRTKAECDAMVKKAKEESQKHWDDVHGKLQAFCDAHAALCELFPSLRDMKPET